jgi:hypothetical protein
MFTIQPLSSPCCSSGNTIMIDIHFFIFVQIDNVNHNLLDGQSGGFALRVCIADFIL